MALLEAARENSTVSSRDLGARFDVPDRTAARWLNKAGLARRRGGPRRVTVSDAEIVRLRDDEGLSFARLGARVGLSESQAHERYMQALAGDAASSSPEK